MKKLILKLTGLKLISALVGLLYSILLVRFFGASAKVDAFFIAMSAVYTITSLIQGGQLAEVFLPEYLKQKDTGGAVAAHNLLSVILNRMVVVVGIALLLLLFLAPYLISLIGPGLEQQYKSLSVELFRLSLLLILFTLIASFVNTTLNAEQIFGRVEVTGFINGIISIVLLIIFYKRWGVFVLVYSLLAGKIVEFLIGLYFLNRIGFRYRFLWSLNNFKLSVFFKVMFTTSGYVGATQIYSVVMTAMASYLPAGSLSVFNYVRQLSAKASGILMGPVSTVFFSKFSSLVVLGKQNLASQLKKPLSVIFVVSFIILCFILAAGQEMLQILWSSKTMTDNEFAIAYWMLSLNFIGFIFSSTGAIYRKSAVALGNAQKLYRNWIFAQLFTALYSFISIYFFGIVGLSTIPVINMFLMALVSFLVSEKSGLQTKRMIFELVSTRKFILFSIITLLSAFGLFYGFKYVHFSNLLLIITKSILLAGVIFVILIKFYKNQLYEIIFSFRKSR